MAKSDIGEKTEYKFTATLRGNGRIVVPKEYREAEELNEGDELLVKVQVLIRRSG